MTDRANAKTAGSAHPAKGMKFVTPSMKGTASALGGRTANACSLINATTVVGSPRASTAWASALTARVHSGQTGAKTTASQRSANKAWVIVSMAGPISAGSVEPMTVKWRDATLPITPSAANSCNRRKGNTTLGST